MMKNAFQKYFRMHAGRLIPAVLFTVYLTMAVIAGINILVIWYGYTSAQTEYDLLWSEYAPAAISESTGTESALSAKPQPDLSKINPDYIGWIQISGTRIDYPVVQGTDNIKYLSSTFSGKKNPSGTIFMGSEFADGFESLSAILYGHNMKDGSMFAELNLFLEEGYLEEYPEITITTREGETLTYHIFAVQVTDINNQVYWLTIRDANELSVYAATLGAPEGTSRMLILSTCVGSRNKEGRLLLYAAMVGET